LRKSDGELGGEGPPEAWCLTELARGEPKLVSIFTSYPHIAGGLTKVELRFAKVQCDVIARGGFNSVADLSRKLIKYIRLRQISQTIPVDLCRSHSSYQGNGMSRDALLVAVKGADS
jgi:hypothetical protein